MPLDPQALQLTSPPPWARWFRSDDLDEVRHFVRRTVGEHSRVAHGRGPLGWELASIFGRRAAVGWGRADVEQTIRAASPGALLHFVIPPGNRYLVGRRRIEPGSSNAMFIAPRWEFTRRSGAGLCIAVMLDPTALAEEMAAREPGGGRPVFRTHEVELTDADVVVIGDAIRAFARGHGAARDAAAGEHGDACLLNAVARVMRPKTPHIRQGNAAPARLGQLEEWIESHLEDPITVGRMCEIAGIGERGLQKAFVQRRGMSPLRFLTERRLVAARRRLESGDEREDVTRVALGLGFHHMGRFAIEYRELFGEPPSQTRRAARR